MIIKSGVNQRQNLVKVYSLIDHVDKAAKPEC